MCMVVVLTICSEYNQHILKKKKKKKKKKKMVALEQSYT